MNRVSGVAASWHFQPPRSVRDGGRVAGRNRSLSQEIPSGCSGLTICGWCRTHGWLGFEDSEILVADVSKMSFACRLSQKAICDIFDTYHHQREL